MKHKLIPLIRKYAAIPVFVSCLFVLYLFLSMGYYAVLGPVVGGVIGGLAAIFVLIVFDRSEQTRADQSPVDYRIAVILAGVYVTSIFTVYRFVSYRRPGIHYAIFGLYAGYIAYEIASGASRKRVLPQILILCFFTYWSTQLAFPAGMYGPDTKYRYLPAIQTALETGFVPLSHMNYMGHLTYVTSGTIITGLSAEISYYLLAVLVLTITLLIISISSVTLPALSRRVTLFAALIFGCMSWTLGRGFHPNKLNFFYPLILLVGIAVFGIYIHSGSARRRWAVVGVIVAPAIIFGHQFSAGAAMVFLMAIGVFSLLTSTVFQGQYRISAQKSTMLFVAAYTLSVFGNPIHQAPLLGRFIGLITSILASNGGGGGPGRYSQFPLDVLLVNTSAQGILFALAVFGAVVALRQSSWELDFGIFWVGLLAVLLLVSLVSNSADTQPQRFYSLLGLFGLNIFASAALLFIYELDVRMFSERSVAILIAVFAVLSLISPVAGIHLSPYGDQIPTFQKFNDDQLDHGSKWMQSYASDDQKLLETNAMSTDLPYYQTSDTTVAVNASRIPENSIYSYSEVTRTTGVTTHNGLSLGGRDYAFLLFEPSHTDNRIYSNKGYSVYSS